MKKKRKIQEDLDGKNIKLAIISLMSDPEVIVTNLATERELIDLTTLDGWKQALYSGIQNVTMTIYKPTEEKKLKRKSIPPKVVESEIGTIKLLLNKKIVFTAPEGTLVIKKGQANESCPDPQTKGWEVFIPILYPVDGYFYPFTADIEFDVELHGRIYGVFRGKAYHTLGTAEYSKITKRFLKMRDCIFIGSGGLAFESSDCR